VQPLAPQVEVTVFEPDIFGILRLAGDRHRQLGGVRLHFDRVDDDLDIAGGKLRVDRPALAPDDFAVDRHHRFDPQGIEQLERIRAGAGDKLGQPIMVAQVDEEHPAMIALAVDPARQPHRLADVGGAQLCASMGAVGVHGRGLLPSVWRSGKIAPALRHSPHALSSREGDAMARPSL